MAFLVYDFFSPFFFLQECTHGGYSLVVNNYDHYVESVVAKLGQAFVIDNSNKPYFCFISGLQMEYLSLLVQTLISFQVRISSAGGGRWIYN